MEIGDCVSFTGVFLWILQNFQEHFSLQNTSGGCVFLTKLLSSPLKENNIFQENSNFSTSKVTSI